MFRKAPVMVATTLALAAFAICFASGISTARAATPSDCVRLVAEQPDSHVVVLAPGCDLREVAKKFPQLEPSGAPLKMSAQLRSIYAANQARASGHESTSPAVLRGCVRAAGPPADAAPEELELCPKGVVNYYGIASGKHRALIYVPKTRTPTYAERLESVGKASCGALSRVSESYARSGSQLPKTIAATLASCNNQFAGNWPSVEVDPPNTAPAAIALTPSPSTERRPIAPSNPPAPDPSAAVSSAAGSMAPPSTTLESSPWPSALVFLALGLLGGVALLVLHRRKASLAPRTPSGKDIVVQRETLAKAVAAIDQQLAIKINDAKATGTKQLREQIATMQRLEEDYQRAIAELRETMKIELNARDESIAALARDKRELEREIDRSRALAHKNDRRLASLRARLQAARQSDPGSSPEPTRKTRGFTLPGGGPIPAT